MRQWVSARSKKKVPSGRPIAATRLHGEVSMFRRFNIAARQGRRVAGALILGACIAATEPAAADPIKIGVLKTTGSGPAYIADEKGYFAAAGVPAELVYFDSAQPIAVATASGDIDFGYTGFTGGFYGLACQGTLKVVAGGVHEVPGVNYQR